MIIAIDGPAGSGKSTIARILAKNLNFRYIETGSMYRAVAWRAVEQELDLRNESDVAEAAGRVRIEFQPGENGQRTMVDGEDLTSQLKNEETGRVAAIVAANPKVRDILVPKQQAMGKEGDVVMDGRDIGSVVFPSADCKFYLDADAKERARRRFEEVKGRFPDITLEEVLQQVEKRDFEDKNRAVSPLICTDDAVRVDTTGKTIEQVVEEMMRVITAASSDQP